MNSQQCNLALWTEVNIFFRCGHCIHFAPTFKQLAADVNGLCLVHLEENINQWVCRHQDGEMWWGLLPLTALRRRTCPPAGNMRSLATIKRRLETQRTLLHSDRLSCREKSNCENFSNSGDGLSNYQILLPWNSRGQHGGGKSQQGQVGSCHQGAFQCVALVENAASCSFFRKIWWDSWRSCSRRKRKQEGDGPTCCLLSECSNSRNVLQ